MQTHSVDTVVPVSSLFLSCVADLIPLPWKTRDISPTYFSIEGKRDTGDALRTEYYTLTGFVSDRGVRLSLAVGCTVLACSDEGWPGSYGFHVSTPTVTIPRQTINQSVLDDGTMEEIRAVLASLVRTLNAQMNTFADMNLTVQYV